MKALKDDMDGVLIFVCACFFSDQPKVQPGLTPFLSQAGLFSGVLTAFVVPQLQNLQVNPAVQSVYYQSQSVQMLDRISQQLASAGSQIPTNLTPPSPYPTFHASASDRRVNIFWLISLVCSLSTALLATLVQQWARGYMRIFQQSGNPLKTARIRLFWLEGAERLPAVAEAVPGLLHVSLMLFFWGLADVIWHIDTAVFVSTVVPIGVGVCLYLYCAIEPIWNPQSPFRTPFSGFIWKLFHNYFREAVRLASIRRELTAIRGMVWPASMEIRRELNAMKETKGRLDRDVRAVHWLVDNINGSNEMQTLILAIPGLFNQKWGRDVLKGVVKDDQFTPIVDSHIQPRPASGLPSPREGTTVRSLCRSVRYHLKTYSYEGDFKDAKERHKRLCVCVETVACLVCCTGVELGLFGEVGEMLSELGDKARTNDSLTIRSNPSFTVRWTCLSLVAIWKMLDGNRLQELAKFALDGIALFQTDYGGPDAVALIAAQTIDDYLKKAWAPVEDLHLAFEPWSRNRSKSEIKGILNSHEASISELEGLAVEVAGMEDVDWRISLLQDTMDGATHKLTRRLPGVFFNELKPTTPIMISEAFNFAPVENPLVLPQLIFPGQQLQSLCTLGQRLRDIVEEQDTEKHDETLKSLKSLREVPIPLRELHYVMRRQLWRLMDLRDGGGLGFTIELFFLALRQQLSSTSSSSELEEIFYTGTFKVITSNWKKSKNSAGTQRILLDILCDLVIRSRGVFSDFSYPPYILDMLLDLVKDMVKGHGGEHPHINDIIQELKDFNFWDRMDNSLRDKALRAIGSFSDAASL